MKDKFNEIIKKISFVTNQPERDWPKMFITLLLIGTVSLLWNVYFYFSIKADIAASEFASKEKSGGTITREDEINALIQVFEEKKVKQSKLIERQGYRLEDPSVL